MTHSSPSALIVDNGRRVLLRLEGQFYELAQEELRALLVDGVQVPGFVNAQLVGGRDGQWRASPVSQDRPGGALIGAAGQEGDLGPEVSEHLA